MDTATLTLSEFLLARIGEDEATAANVSVFIGPGPDFRPQYQGIRDRVLAECAAKRRIVNLHELQVSGKPPWTSVGCRICDVSTLTGDVEGDGPCPTLRALALPYADHPDYRAEWRP